MVQGAGLLSRGRRELARWFESNMLRQLFVCLEVWQSGNAPALNAERPGKPRCAGSTPAASAMSAVPGKTTFPGMMPERPKGAHWKCDGRACRTTPEFESPSFRQILEDCRSGLSALPRKQLVPPGARAFESLIFLQDFSPLGAVR